MVRTVAGSGPFSDAVGVNHPLWAYTITLGAAGLILWALVAANRSSFVRFRAVFEASPNGILLLQGGRVVHANPAAVRLFAGAGFQRLISTPLAELSPARQEEAGSEETFERRLALADERGITRFDWVHSRLDGTTFPCEVSLDPAVVDGEHGYVELVHDMTRWRAQEEKLKEALTRADAGNRSKGEFLANMGPEIRAPLNAMMGSAQVLDSETSLPAQSKERVRKILTSGQHLIEFIDDVLAIARLEAGDASVKEIDFEPGALLGDLERMFRPEAEEKGLTLRVECQPGVPSVVRSDRTKILAILAHLLDNAVKHTSSGNVGLYVTSGPATTTERKRLRFEVADTGDGIPLEDKQRIFGAFEQKAGGGGQKLGTGLGLPLARRYARLLGGDVTLQSNPGEGIRFRVDVEVRDVSHRRRQEDEPSSNLGAPSR